jgi:ketosteroid isomerase-like protein
MKSSFCLSVVIALASCQSQQQSNNAISKDEMLKIVKQADDQFSTGVRKKDSAFLANIYSDDAQYVQPNTKILKGKTEIGKEWAGFLRLKENPVDLILNISEVGGNREIIYETGVGYTLLADSTKWNFNYVNVWRVQSDGTYRLEIDTYMPMGK